MKHFLLIILLFTLSAAQAQRIEVTGSRKKVRSSGDVLMLVTPAAGFVTTLALKDWEGLKQGIFTGVTAVGMTYALKYLVDKERPDRSDNHSFPSMHSTVSFGGAGFIQKRYGWKWGIPAYLLSTYVGWSRVYGKKHDWWDVTAGAVIGIGSAYIFTKPFADKYNLSISPLVGNNSCGLYLSMMF